MIVSRIFILTLVILALVFTSCQQETEMVNAQVFGGEVTIEESVALAEVYSSPEKYKDKEIRIEGTIKQVCQHKGCWIKLTDGSKELTVRFKDYVFFVPKDAANSKVIVQGIFNMEPDKHVEEESIAQKEGKEPAHAEGDEHGSDKEHAKSAEMEKEVAKKALYSFTASAVIIYDDSSSES